MQEKLLIIQTESAVIKTFEAVLGSEYKLIVKNDGLEAIDWLEKGNHADLIIADAGMPYLNSVDFIKELRSNIAHRSIPILILSDLDKVTERNLYIHAGATDFAIKPLSKSQLKQRIRQLLGKSTLDSQDVLLAS
ncbi:response regulator [Xanthocytophaga agilis]|uniref:Response regulator n=1 Tax=Xanthocytophaga agilis TaxID=3048010 RepID=A0AAE3UJ69_9BACT|nr:response regulator [Xanthocytophaga agilis]MDJ1505487.1 response regulator [Xanthocytophaga agilis]